VDNTKADVVPDGFGATGPFAEVVTGEFLSRLQLEGLRVSTLREWCDQVIALFGDVQMGNGFTALSKYETPNLKVTALHALANELPQAIHHTEVAAYARTLGCTCELNPRSTTGSYLLELPGPFNTMGLAADETFHDYTSSMWTVIRSLNTHFKVDAYAEIMKRRAK
jgi:hypothetical protein